MHTFTSKSRALLLSTFLSVSVLFAASAAATGEVPLAKWLYATASQMERSVAPGEDRVAFDARLELISRSLSKAALPHANGRGWTASELSLATLVLWNEESKFDQRVHAGLKHPQWTQDNGRARCMGQIHVNVKIPQEKWEQLAGTDEGATQMCADATAQMWVAQAKQCGVWSGRRADRAAVAKTFAAYGSGGNCTPTDQAWARADKWLAAMAKRPDRSPVDGYRRVMPSEMPPAVVEEARLIAKRIDPKFVGDTFNTEKAALGDIYSMNPPHENEYKFLVEKHAGGKIGVSVLVSTAPIPLPPGPLWGE